MGKKIQFLLKNNCDYSFALRYKSSGLAHFLGRGKKRVELLNITAVKQEADQDGFEWLIYDLEPLTRATVVLSYQWGLTGGEISQVLGIDVNQVQLKLSHAHRMIKAKLPKD